MRKFIALNLVLLSLTQSFANVGSHSNLSTLFDRVQSTHKQALAVGGIDTISYASVAAPPAVVIPQSKPKEKEKEKAKETCYSCMTFGGSNYGWLLVQTPARWMGAAGNGVISWFLSLFVAIALSPVAIAAGIFTGLTGISGTIHRYRWNDFMSNL